MAEIIGTIGGFGSSVFFVPIANFYLDFHSVLGITALFHLSSNISKMVLFKDGVDKHLLINMGLPSVIFVIVGGLLSEYLKTSVLELILGLFLIGLSLYFLIFNNVQIGVKRPHLILGGALSGFASGLIGTGGAIRGISLSAFNLEKNVYVATSAAIDLSIDLSRSLVYYFSGYMDALRYLPVLLLIGFVGTWLGRKILQRIPQEKFKTISLSLILLIGLISMVKPMLQLLLF